MIRAIEIRATVTESESESESEAEAVAVAVAETGAEAVTGAGSARYRLPRTAVLAVATLASAVAVSLLGAANATAAGSTRVAGDPVTVTLGTTLGPGSLVISVSDDQVTLSAPLLNSTGTLFSTTGSLKPITVTDNRTADPGWTLTGVISGIPQLAATGSLQFDGQDLGWVPSLVAESPVQAINLGLTVKPGPGSGSGTAGLAQPRVLAFTETGFGLGSAQLGATLHLDLPTRTTAGTYTVTLTLTAI